MNKVFVNRQPGVNCVRDSIVGYVVGPSKNKRGECRDRKRGIERVTG